MQCGHEPTNSLAVKLYTIVISAISTYYTDATKSPLPCEGTTPGEGWLHRPFPPSPCPLPPRGEREIACRFHGMCRGDSGTGFQPVIGSPVAGKRGKRLVNIRK